MIKCIIFLWMFTCYVRAFTFPATDNTAGLVLNSYNEPYDGGVKSNGYKFGYELSDGQTRAEFGSLVRNSNNKDSLQVEGSYSFNSPEGDTIIVSYVADDKGYRPKVSRVETNNVGRSGQIDIRFGQN